MKRTQESTWAHSITRRLSLPLWRLASDDGSSAVRSGAPLPHTNISPIAAHLPSRPHPLHMVVCIDETVKLQNSKPLSLTFCARADIMRIRIKSRRPFAASEVIFSPKRTRRASDSKVPFLGCLVLAGLSSSQVRCPRRFVVLADSSSSRVRCSLGFDALAGSSSTRGSRSLALLCFRVQLLSASFLYCRARHGISAGTYLYPFAFVSP